MTTLRRLERSIRLLPPFLFITAVMLAGTAALAEETRIWTSSANGRQFKGSLVKVEEDLISIRRESDSAIFKVKRSDLIQADLDWIDKHATTPVSAVEDLSELVSGVPAATGTPAIGVLLVMDGATRGIGVSGVRKAGSTAKAEIDDKWHLGSSTKSMTATLAATFVEEGAISWETTVSEILGKKLKISKDYEAVTLGMLLANRGGIPGDVPDSVYGSIETGAHVADLRDRDIMNQRAKYAEAVLNLMPSRPPNSGFEYSNSGFVVAGAMIEEVSGKPWERLIEERIFHPLGMTNSGFGNAAHADKNDPTQPWPHKNGTTPVAPGAGDDNVWVLGPAGTVHGSLKDLARYISMHAAREIGPVIKKKETFEFLHTALPENEGYARGWIVSQTEWSQGPAIAHDGSNTMNYCSIWIAPEGKTAVAAFTNRGENGKESCQSAIQAVVEKYLK